MANIKEYDAGNLTLNPTDKGTDAAAAAGRRIGGFYNQVAQGMDQVAASETDTGNRIGSAVGVAGAAAVKWEDQREISHGTASFAQLTADLTAKRNDWIKNADPNDTSVVSKFNEQVLQPALDNFQSAFSTENGQAFAEQHADALRTHMFQQNSADLSVMAKEAISVNIKKSENAWTNTARSDPSSTNFLLEQAEHSVGAIISSSPALSASDAATVRAEGLQKTKEAIVKAGALGTIEKAADPEKAATDFANRYPDYINGGEIDQLAKAAQYYKRLNVAEDRADRTTANLQAKDDFNKKVNALEASTMPVNPGARPQLPPDYYDKLRELSTHPGAALEPGRLKTMVDNGEHIQAGLNKPEPLGPVSHDTTMQLLTQIRATDQSKLQSNDPIYKAYGDGKLNTTDFNFLQKEFQDRKTPEGEALNQDRTAFFKNYATVIAGPSYAPATDDPKVYNAEMDARRVENDLKKKGLDPHLAYDPSSQYFLGKPERLQKWQTNMQQDLQTRAQSPSNLPAPVGTSVPRPATPTPPEKGLIKDGYEFLGGNPGEAASWRKVGERT